MGTFFSFYTLFQISFEILVFSLFKCVTHSLAVTIFEIMTIKDTWIEPNPCWALTGYFTSSKWVNVSFIQKRERKLLIWGHLHHSREKIQNKSGRMRSAYRQSSISWKYLQRQNISVVAVFPNSFLFALTAPFPYMLKQEMEGGRFT